MKDLFNIWLHLSEKTNFSNKSVDIQSSAHDAFLEKPSSGDAQHRKIGKPNNLEMFEPIKPKGLNRRAKIG